ncbi:MAG: hypothetical protein KGI32_06220 [Gammaproteobacteria bacterium]|nr:hypothetical protein [Gammaproteobacteria bacterium]MDE1887716.1 hypothetical protein [Gammaproteobacteria bacterium]MDE2023002.1 hypothetical protein [Gammaproteobacteria bacterium]MDE2138964.1 hypothetical protein [Gammaproteobacteria bacterium]HVA54759.1 hypothetical protein [Gammaproteobacteria bacterium]
MNPTVYPIVFSTSAYVPIALGFFGLGTGYLIYFPQELFGYPKRDEAVNLGTGMWGIWLPGFCQFVTGTILFLGLTLFQVFKGPPLYMAALAFSAYGIHWFALGYNRMKGADPRPNAFMAIGFLAISALGAIVFFHAGDWPVGLLFLGLCGVYLADIPASLKAMHPFSERALGFFHMITGFWLIYLMFAATLDIASGFHLPL